MYNGIGLTTARGSGTNGFVQRNLSSVKRTKDRVDYKTEEEVARLDKQLNRQPNQDILQHDRKRRVELKCLEMQELMEDQGYSPEDIEQKVGLFRKMLMDKEEITESPLDKDEHGRPIAKETHQIAEANQEKNQRLREAFGLTDYVDGSAFDPNRKAKEEAAKAQALATKKYAIVKSSESEEEKAEEEPPAKKKKKSHSHGDSSSPEHREKRRKHKKHRHRRSQSGRHKKSKKKCGKRHEGKVRKVDRPGSASNSQSESDSESAPDDEVKEGKSPAYNGNRHVTTLKPAVAKLQDLLPDCQSPRTKSNNGGGSSPATLKVSSKRSRSLSYSPVNRSCLLTETKDTEKQALEVKARPSSPGKEAQSLRNLKLSEVNNKLSARSKSRSHSRSHKSRSIEKRRVHSRSRSDSSCSAGYSRSHSRNSRSPSIRRRHGSPSHLDKRRITRSRSRSRSKSRNRHTKRRERSRSYYHNHDSHSRSRSCSQSRSYSSSRSSCFSSSRQHRACH